MSASGLSKARLGRMRQVLSGHVARGELPGLVALVARRGEVHVEAIGTTEVGGSGGPLLMLACSGRRAARLGRP